MSSAADPARSNGCANTEALGKVFEHYVGSQLQLLRPELALHDVEYRRGQRAADWIVVMPKAVLVVEVKATPLTAGARVGTSRLQQDLERTPGCAIEQINRTATLIMERDPAFRDVPDDRPLIGLVVTLEPYYQSNSDLVWSRPESTVPVMTAASRELEALVTLTDAGIDEVLVELVADEEPLRLEPRERGRQA